LVEVADIQIADLGDPSIKIMTYGLIKQINESSVKAGRNRNVYFEQLPIKDDGTMYPVTMSFIHNDVEMRTQIILNGEGEKITLDMGFDEFNALPTHAEILDLIKIAEGETDA
tara:strand:+ start:174 stop:512 length:339 start_codon:yes stop_codon:yes gene_type:complete